MENMYYIGLDVHKKTISYCVKDGGGRIYAEAEIPATRLGLDMWMKTLPQPWTAAMEATIFTAWIYDHIKPHAVAVKVAHPLMLRAIAAAKKKNDRIDAHKIADCLRCDFLPECYMASTEIRERRRTLRYRNLLVRQAKRKLAEMLNEMGVNSSAHLDRALQPIRTFAEEAKWWEENPLIHHKPSSRNSSHYIIKKHLIPHFGSFALSDIDKRKAQLRR